MESEWFDAVLLSYNRLYDLLEERVLKAVVLLEAIDCRLHSYPLKQRVVPIDVIGVRLTGAEAVDDVVCPLVLSDGPYCLIRVALVLFVGVGRVAVDDDELELLQ